MRVAESGRPKCHLAMAAGDPTYAVSVRLRERRLMPEPAIRTLRSFGAARRLNFRGFNWAAADPRVVAPGHASLGLDAICFPWEEPLLALLLRSFKNSRLINSYKRQGGKHTVPQVCRIHARRLAPCVGEQRFGAGIESCGLDDVDCQQIGVDVGPGNQRPCAGGENLSFRRMLSMRSATSSASVSSTIFSSESTSS